MLAASRSCMYIAKRYPLMRIMRYDMFRRCINRLVVFIVALPDKASGILLWPGMVLVAPDHSTSRKPGILTHHGLGG